MLVASLFAKPLSVATGVVTGMAVVISVAWMLDRWVFTLATAVFCIVSVMRLGIVWILRRRMATRSQRRLERLYEISVFTHAALYGICSALVIQYHTRDAVMTLMIAQTLGYAIGSSARNAGRPAIAVGQLLVTFVPIIVACVAHGSPALLVLAVTMLTLIPTIGAMTMTIFRTLRSSIVTAQTSERLAQKMETLALTDAVTALPNRAGVSQALVKRVMHLDTNRKLALFWIGLDRFKEINDLLGHQAGDRVLREIARRLHAAVPAGAIVSRFGGDEFVVLHELAERAPAERLADVILDRITDPIHLEEQSLRLSASTGVALLPDDAADADALLKAADLALHHAKLDGRGRVRFFDAGMTDSLARAREMEEELRGAIERDELTVFYQPMVDLATGRTRCFEALVRWFHPTKGEIAPQDFIPVAERSGLIVTLGNWITRAAARAAACWPADIAISVNLSPVQITAPGAAMAVKAALRETGLPPERLVLEVTESLFVEDCPETGRFIHDLAAIGVRFAMDDFGTGYSSLAYINRYPFSKIKVDRSFVSGPQAGPKADAIIRAMAELGAQLGLTIVAEGIETAAQAQATAQAGCTLGQGYFFGRAMPDHLATARIAQERGITDGALSDLPDTADDTILTGTG